MDRHIGRRLQSHLHFWVFLATKLCRHIAGAAIPNFVDQQPDTDHVVAVARIDIAQSNLPVGTATEAVVFAGYCLPHGEFDSTSLMVLRRKEGELKYCWKQTRGFIKQRLLWTVSEIADISGDVCSLLGEMSVIEY